MKIWLPLPPTTTNKKGLDTPVVGDPITKARSNDTENTLYTPNSDMSRKGSQQRFSCLRKATAEDASFDLLQVLPSNTLGSLRKHVIGLS